MGDILQRDKNFAAFMAVRILYQFATMGFAFYIVYGLRRFEMDTITAGYLTATLTIAQTIANAGMGWLSDRVGHKKMLAVGMVSVALSSLLAWAAPALEWFYLVFIISALANVAYWTIGMALVVEFGSEAERPMYIGMSNTLVAPFTIIAPILGGWIADSFGYQTTFLLSAIGGVIVTLMMLFLVKDPRQAIRERM
jgi:MFS family permease